MNLEVGLVELVGLLVECEFGLEGHVVLLAGYEVGLVGLEVLLVGLEVLLAGLEGLLVGLLVGLLCSVF